MLEQTALDTADIVASDDASRPFVAEWNGLVSTTNWEKGRIILEWRQALIAGGADVQEYSDDAWSRRVGTVSGQHVGRLRRVYERFAGAREQYPGLYWSHFQAAIEWPDPELWLEGAVQNDWSVSEMRRQRWQAYGAAEADEPRDADIITAEFDEDALPTRDGLREERLGPPDFESGSSGLGPDLDQGPDFGDADPFSQDALSEPTALYVDEAPLATVRPFEHLPELPADLSEALEIFKLAILRHKLAAWRDVPAESVLAALDGLKQLVLAPSE
jgi:hypothetical protein